MINLSGNNDDYIKLKKSEMFLEIGVGCGSTHGWGCWRGLA